METNRIKVETPFGTLVAEPSGGGKQYPGIWIYLCRREKDEECPDRFLSGNCSVSDDGHIEQQLVLVEAVMEDPRFINAEADRCTLRALTWGDSEDDDPTHTVELEQKPLRFDIEKIKKGDVFMTKDGEYHVAGEDSHRIGEARYEDEMVVYDDEGNSYFASDFDEEARK